MELTDRFGNLSPFLGVTLEERVLVVRCRDDFALLELDLEAKRAQQALFDYASESGDVGAELAEVDVVALDADGGRAQSRHEAGARGIAEGLLAVGTVEAEARGGEGVDVGAVDVVGAVAAELGAEVVDGDEENVGTLGVAAPEFSEVGPGFFAALFWVASGVGHLIHVKVDGLV